MSRVLPVDVQQAVNRVVRRSTEYAFAHPEASRPFVRAHAQEMDETVMRQHIALYVNEFSVDSGAEGWRAVELLLTRARDTGVVPPFTGQMGVRAGSERGQSGV